MILYDSTNWKHTKIKEQWTKTDTRGIPDLISICADLQLLIENENLNPLGLMTASQEPDLLNQLNHDQQSQKQHCWFLGHWWLQEKLVLGYDWTWTLPGTNH